MSMTVTNNWLAPQTAKQIKRYDAVCARLYSYFKSYPRISAALQHQTGQYISAQSVRLWIRDRKIPLHYAILLADMIEADPFDLVPGLQPFVVDWQKRGLIN